MKAVLLVALLSAAVSTVMVAQTDSTASPDRVVYAWGGTTIPYLPGETKDIWKHGWNAGLGFGLAFPPGEIGYAEIFASVDYNRFPFNESGYRSWLLSQYPSNQASQITNGSIIARGTTKIVTAMVNLKGTFSATGHSIAPYFLIGFGYIYTTSDSIAIAGNSSYSISGENQSTVAWSVGVGVEIPAGDKLTGFLQGRSVLGVYDRTRQYFPLSAGIRFRL
jgi:opacity protein-like surface antigen